MRRGVTVLLWILVPVIFLFLSWNFSAWEASLGVFLRAHLLLDGVLFAWVALLLLWRLPPRQARRLNRGMLPVFRANELSVSLRYTANCVIDQYSCRV